MFGYFALAALALFGVSRSRASRKKRRTSPRPSWEATILYPGARGEYSVWVTNESTGSSTGYTLEHTADEVSVRAPKNIENAIDLAADIVSESVYGDNPTIAIDVYRYDAQDYVRRVVLGNFSVTSDGRIIAQAEITIRGRFDSTRNYAASSLPEVVHRFVSGQLEQTWNEGLFA